MAKIEIDGEVRRSFIFPADVDSTFHFYSQIENILDWLLHISRVHTYSPDRFRMLYHTVELGIYHVNLYCDMQVVLDAERRILTIQPLHDFAPVESQANLHSLTAQGYYSSESIFHAEGDRTRIDFHLKLLSRLPVPLAARLVIPASMLDRIAQSITHRRIQEIANSFFDRSIQTYRKLNGDAGQAD